MITTLSKQAASAARVGRNLATSNKNEVLYDMAASLREHATEILAANRLDMQYAEETKVDAAMQDRLLLNEHRIEDMALAMENVAQLDDPVGQRKPVSTQENGLDIHKLKIPLGVVCMIYEARPNVTAEASALCFKSGNSVILRGGKEAIHSSKAISSVLQGVLRQHKLPESLITVIPSTDRAHLATLMQQKDYIDVIIPRGGEGLINYVSENSQVPVIQHYKGVCHLYVDKDADFTKAINILVNGKTQRTGVCNALEGLLVHSSIKDAFLPLVSNALQEKGVTINACKQSAAFFEHANVLGDDEFGEEYLCLEIAVKVVKDFDDALDHIEQFGSHHTEVICTENETTAQIFQRSVDASVVTVNASSRFSDGGQLGLGAEIGIATSKLHAYGPMGLEALTTEKFLVTGNGQVRA